MSSYHNQSDGLTKRMKNLSKCIQVFYCINWINSVRWFCVYLQKVDFGLCSNCMILCITLTLQMTMRIRYSPPMPSLRDQLCQRMPMALTIKTFCIFKSQWWRKKGYSGFFLSDRGPCSAGFDMTTVPGKIRNHVSYL